MTQGKRNTAPPNQPFLKVVCHNVPEENFWLLTDAQMKAQYARGLAYRDIWAVQPCGAELDYIERLGLSLGTAVA